MSRKRASSRNERKTLAEISKQILELRNLTTGQLREKHLEVFGEPTRSRNKEQLRRKVAWRIQELAEGGLSERAKARIEELAAQVPLKRVRKSSVSASGGKRVTRDPRLPKPGTTITREHGGKTHEVKVLADGFEYRGKAYRHLSVIAREITGTNWNGYLFFGLQKR